MPVGPRPCSTIAPGPCPTAPLRCLATTAFQGVEIIHMRLLSPQLRVPPPSRQQLKVRP